jgi:hypothetical protein
MIHCFPCPFAHKTSIKNPNLTTVQIIYREILTKSHQPSKEGNLVRNFNSLS